MHLKLDSEKRDYVRSRKLCFSSLKWNLYLDMYIINTWMQRSLWQAWANCGLEVMRNMFNSPFKTVRKSEIKTIHPLFIVFRLISRRK